MTNLEPYFLIKLLHILLFVYWLGGDIGVFYSAIHVRKHELTIPARQTALKILAWVDQIPRFCLVFMLPVGYSLAAQLGVVRASTMVLFATWLVAFAWATMVASMVGDRLSDGLRFDVHLPGPQETAFLVWE